MDRPYGPPEEGLSYFGLPGWAEVFQAFDADVAVRFHDVHGQDPWLITS